ncbi:MAG: acyl-CoA dehydrogenase family protein [Actinomycetota bacterium]
MATSSDLVQELNTWLSENWDPELTVGEWWDKLGMSGWAAPSYPTDSYGKGLSREDSVKVQQTIAEFGALGAPGGLGLLLAGPTIATHGTREQKDLYLPAIVTGKAAWCQLFSEPGAGSDLAGLGTKAIKDGEEWMVNGQKVWPSGGKLADMGMLIARTDVNVPKHQGISYFAFDMHQDGVDIRPLREMTGQALFNEVFLTDTTVPDAALIGGLNNGWAVANTTLAFERAGLGAGGGNESGGAAQPGTIAGDLARRVGDFVSSGGRRRAGGPGGVGGLTSLLIQQAKETGQSSDAGVRQNLAQLYIMNEIARMNNARSKGMKSKGQDIPGLGNIAKLTMSRILRLARDTGFSLLGPAGTVFAYKSDEREAGEEFGGPFASSIISLGLFAQGPQIYGGTDEIQHNIIGERVLGLSKEPNNDKVTPFSELPKNG